MAYDCLLFVAICSFCVVYVGVVCCVFSWVGCGWAGWAGLGWVGWGWVGLGPGLTSDLSLSCSSLGIGMGFVFLFICMYLTCVFLLVAVCSLVFVCCIRVCACVLCVFWIIGSLFGLFDSCVWLLFVGDCGPSLDLRRSSEAVPERR